MIAEDAYLDNHYLYILSEGRLLCFDIANEISLKRIYLLPKDSEWWAFSVTHNKLYGSTQKATIQAYSLD
jgi:hypothetical protein